MLLSTTAAAAVALVAGLTGGQALAPAASSGPPDPGLITAQVVLGELHTEITTRADVAYADAVDVGVDTSAIAGPAVVTGAVPEVGAELDVMSVALEVAGRPVIVLPGELPAYRTLRVGVSGPDVAQFKAALRAVGIDGGDPADDTFTEQTANAVTALYAQAGYPAPEGDPGAEDAVQSAQATLTAARQGLAMAENELSRAGAGAPPAEALAASNAVANAQRELDAAVNASPADPVQVAQLGDALALARAQQDELLAAPDVSAQQLAVQAAEESVDQASSALAAAQRDALPTLPAGEVLFLTDLPRRVDAVTAERGAVLSGPAMTVSGATLSLEATVAAADAGLLAAGDEVYFELPDGIEHRAVIATLAPDPSDATRWAFQATPDPLSADQVRQLQGQSVRVRIPVAATEGDVLSVPAAALTSGPGGETRVEVVVGDPRDGEQSRTRLAVVRTGLATPDGVEVTSVEAELHEGDLVVVGR
ncbi:hypothetical protein AGMMS50218_04340 [Actinomycetota bacterium]|nr:hypothetical protein AGMMS50218_04340 [Actinomycetota bacterium]